MIDPHPNKEERKMDNQKVFAMEFSRVYPLLVAKAERKGRTQQEVDQVIGWLTGYTPADLLRFLPRALRELEENGGSA